MSDVILGVATLLFVRSLVLAIFEPKSWHGKLTDLFLALVFAILTAILLLTGLKYDPASLAIFTAFIGVFLALRLAGLLQNSALLKITKWIFFGAFWSIATLSFALSGFTHLAEDEPIAKVVITGKKLKKWVEWKNPDDISRQKWIDTSEVILETATGEVIGRYFIYGDLVAVRARVIRFRPILNFLGIPNVCHLEAIYNGYTSMEKHIQLPHLGYPLPLPVSFFRHLWESGFYLNWKSPWIKSTTLESNYFPLYDRHHIPLSTSFWLTITEGGLSSLPKGS